MSTVFTEAERAALALAEEGTRLADAHHSVSGKPGSEATCHPPPAAGAGGSMTVTWAARRRWSPTR
ncbi:hypothetical protein ABH927_000229 [Planotetraspora sp. GP83]